VADGNGQRIGSIIGTRDRLEAEQGAGHLHDLHFLGAAIADYRLLDLQRGILVDGHILLGTGQQNDPSCMTHLDAGGDIGIEKKLLDGHRVGLEGFQQGMHILIDLHKPLGKGDTGCRGDGAVAHISHLAPIVFDHAVADRAVAGVNA